MGRASLPQRTDRRLPRRVRGGGAVSDRRVGGRGRRLLLARVAAAGDGGTAGVRVAAAWLSSPGRASSPAHRHARDDRAGAIDEQESELRRIERDLHDGAQARLVALGMSLGMAEHTLAEDPERAGSCSPRRASGPRRRCGSCATSPAGSTRRCSPTGDWRPRSRHSELNPLPVSVSVSLNGRLPRWSRARPTSSSPRRSRTPASTPRRSGDDRRAPAGRPLELEVCDDGRGGAEPRAAASGLRRRVEALDGLLASPAHRGADRIHAELPCGS